MRRGSIEIRLLVLLADPKTRLHSIANNSRPNNAGLTGVACEGKID
jgi:hypothetical protein